jgi:hypothetical protein
LLLALIWTQLPYAATEPAELARQFEQASYSFDADLADQVLSAYEPLLDAGAGDIVKLAYVRAALLVAELRRGDYEHGQLPREERRALGRSIDRVAKPALEMLATLPESSERYRLQADLYGTLIRSNFRGMKYQPLLERALDAALELDENNARAWVSRSRRPLFAPPKHGGDPALALEYLNRALALQPDLVQALLFRGVANSKLGFPEAAGADWARAAALNPNTAGARDRLLDIELPGGEQPGGE